ncbi:hypothetical protein RFI_03723 [Reticulomyxa filosa]|uniref:Prolyl 4-hydroxylase alpha subunit Fe(2+) 2OG dioxygenase domain-containing protein n=1 Tax=Reticulomyxa filosa TaxID=46433 RepID=X6P5N4_RETFI|nr:hypothetical protein RFI_03723 [Reticulomyxa filosa]|eukprot:ETO33384.1 hypothetical protein RFI_03723 [Reticulomyxa filosa]
MKITCLISKELAITIYFFINLSKNIVVQNDIRHPFMETKYCRRSLIVSVAIKNTVFNTTIFPSTKFSQIIERIYFETNCQPFFFAKGLFVLAVVFVSASQDPLPSLVFQPIFMEGKCLLQRSLKTYLATKFCRSESVQNQVEVLEDSRYFGVEYGISEKIKEEENKNIDEEKQKSLHAKTIEIINYTVGNSLGWHVDVGGTVLTMVIMLSEPNVDFTGEELEFMHSQHLFNSEIQEQGMSDAPPKDSDFYAFRKTLDWHKGDFVVFPITSAHCVKPVLSRHRSTFVIEFKYGIYYGLNPR